MGERDAAIFLIRGDEAALRALLHSHPGPLEELAARWHRRGQAGGVSRAVVAGDREELLRQLERPRAALVTEPGKLAFVFPGSGNHYLGMGRSLGVALPGIYRRLDAEVEHLQGHLMPQWTGPWRASWAEGWEADSARTLALSPERMILGQVAHGVAVSDAARLFGLRPDAYIGYSLGESAALFASRTWRDRDLMFRRTLSSPLFRTELSGPGTVARAAWGTEPGAEWKAVVVNRPADEVRGALVGTAALLIVNAPRECVLGGKATDVDRTVAALKCEALALEGVPTVHLPLVNAVAGAYRAIHQLPTNPPEGVRFYSGAWARSYVPTEDTAADSILANAVGGFDFQATIEQAWADGVRIFLELGPQGSCARMIARILGARPHLAVTACQRGADGFRSLLTALARLAEAGVPLDLEPIYGREGGIVADAPKPPATIAVAVGGRRPAPPPAPAARNAALHNGAGAPSVRRNGAAHNGAAHNGAAHNGAAHHGASTPATHGAAHAGASAWANPAAAQNGDPGNPAAAGQGGSNGRPRQPDPVLLSPRSPGADPARAAATLSRGAAPLLGQFPPAALFEPGASTFGALHPRSAGGSPSATAQNASFGAPHHSPATQAHQQFLLLAQRSLALQTQALLEQQRLISLLSGAEPITLPVPIAPAEPVAFDRAACFEFAVGSLAKVLGPEFAEVDRFPTRVRLPAEPLMLCDRILSVEGTRGVLGPGRCVTEHDVRSDSWYLENGRAPVCISVEAGQADLFLSAYLGIDLQTRGERVYRLLDAKIVFHRDLPRVGETIRYDIKIDRFIQQGDTWLFFFRFDGTIAGAPFITMYDGCAGFFSPEQLATGRGIVTEPSSQRAPRREATTPYAPLVPLAPGTLDARQLDALRSGDLGAAFGGPFTGRTLCPALRLPAGRMQLVDRILELNPTGGRFGLGLVHGEADVTPDAWYLTSHFIDDPVMPGTLMYECCLHTLRVLLLRLGWVAEGDAEVRCEPIDGVASQLRCRGQVTVDSRKVSYRVEIKELGYDPEPYVLATAAMYVDGRYVVEMEGMALRLRGLSRAQVEATWASAAPAKKERYTRKQIVAFSEGLPSEGFGEQYRPFDRDRRIARLPRPPFLFIDRVVKCDDPPWVLKPGGWVECELEVDPHAWYFAASRQRAMPFAVLAEAALQPCGWLAAYLGSALCSEDDLYFRNLDGSGTSFFEVRPDAGTLTSRARLTKASQAGGMILQEFEMEILSGPQRVYAGKTGFGFFPAAALAQQVGVRGAKLAELAGTRRAFELPREAPLSPDGCAGFEIPRGLALSAQAFSVIDRIDALELDGGAHGQGFIAGAKRIDPNEWFFAAHFYQDPVMPGSLGLEALLQLLKVFARERFGACLDTHRFQATALGHEHKWQYRGQVLPTNHEVQVQATLTHVADGPEPLLIADGQLAVDGRVIYTMKNFALRLVPGAS
ncbi:MAG: omega-3 polyunsaturated fatty acid synthase [Myxococcaceae bacterium]|nr:omega-3 polyunsaturated fatty acid synthase [Myxococcaceae bacterium]